MFVPIIVPLCKMQLSKKKKQLSFSPFSYLYVRCSLYGWLSAIWLEILVWFPLCLLYLEFIYHHRSVDFYQIGHLSTIIISKYFPIPASSIALLFLGLHYQSTLAHGSLKFAHVFPLFVSPCSSLLKLSSVGFQFALKIYSVNFSFQILNFLF